MYQNLTFQLLYPFLSGLLLTVLFTPLTIKFARKFNLMDNPKIRPHPAHVQKRTVPRAGGLPIFLAITISILLFAPLDKHTVGIILSLVVLLITGLSDDVLIYFSPIKRLFLLVLASSIVVGSGVGISYVSNPFGGVIRFDTWIIPFEFYGPHSIVVIADIIAFLWIVGIMNMVNWSKGVDGQMPGITAVAALTIGYLSFNLFLKGDPNQFPIAILSLIVAGSSLGFLVFNWFPSKIFPGFSGSTILGFMIATLSILSGAKLATAFLVLLIPAADFLYTILRRILAKQSPFKGDSKHLHHLLLKRGWSHSRISLFYIISCAILGLLSTQLTSEGKLFALLGFGLLAIGALIWLHWHYQLKD